MVIVRRHPRGSRGSRRRGDIRYHENTVDLRRWLRQRVRHSEWTAHHRRMRHHLMRWHDARRTADQSRVVGGYRCPNRAHLWRRPIRRWVLRQTAHDCSGRGVVRKAVVRRLMRMLRHTSMHHVHGLKVSEERRSRCWCRVRVRWWHSIEGCETQGRNREGAGQRLAASGWLVRQRMSSELRALICCCGNSQREH